MRSWRKATVNILEHQSTRSWWILSARVCIVDCIRVKAHKFNRVSKQETLDLNPWHTKHVKCFYSDHVNSLGWMIEVLSFTGTKLFSQLPSAPRRIDKNQPFWNNLTKNWTKIGGELKPACLRTGSNFGLTYGLVVKSTFLWKKVFFFFWPLLTAGSFQNLRHEGVTGFYKGLIPSVLR